MMQYTGLSTSLSVIIILLFLLISSLVVIWGPATGRAKIRVRLEAKKRGLSSQIRAEGRVCLSIKRRIRELSQEKSDIQGRVREIRNNIETARSDLLPLIVISEQFQGGDKFFVMIVSQTNPDVRDLFLSGKRTCGVWAPDESISHRRMSSRFSEESGYRISLAGVLTNAPDPPETLG
jgi:hypothetical protein